MKIMSQIINKNQEESHYRSLDQHNITKVKKVSMSKMKVIYGQDCQKTLIALTNNNSRIEFDLNNLFILFTYDII